MTRILVISFSDHARDPRVDRQIMALSPHHQLVTAGFGPGPVESECFVDLTAASSTPAARSNQTAGLQRIVSRRFEAAYWGNRLSGRRFLDWMRFGPMPWSPTTFRRFRSPYELRTGRRCCSTRTSTTRITSLR